MSEELTVPTTGPYSGFEKGQPVCPGCQAHGSIEYPEKRSPQKTLFGGKVEEWIKKDFCICTRCWKKYPRDFVFHKL